MFQNLVSLNSAPPVAPSKSATTAGESGQGGFGRALKDAGSSDAGHRSNADKANANQQSGASADRDSANHVAANRAQNKNTSSGAANRSEAASDATEGTEFEAQDAANGLEASTEVGHQAAVLVQPTGLEKALARAMDARSDNGIAAHAGKLQNGVAALKGGETTAAAAAAAAAATAAVAGGVAAGEAGNMTGSQPIAPTVGLNGEPLPGAKGGAMTLAELAAGTVPGAAVQAGMSQAAMKAENRNPLDKNSKSLPGMADALKDAGIVAKDVAEPKTAGLRAAAAAEENMQRAGFDTGAAKDGESILLAGKGAADAAAIKPGNDLGLGSLSPSSQTLLTAVKENSNWNKMLSAPTVHFSENVKPNGKVLQALSVTLNPIELGKLELNMRMSQGQITIDVRTESDQAYRTLLVDQDALVNNLRSLGFKVDGITINGPQSDNAAQFQNPDQTQDQGMGEGLGGEASRNQDSPTDDTQMGLNEGVSVDEKDRDSLDII